MNTNTSIRIAVASTLGSRCALDMLEACDVTATDADGAYLVNVADPMPGDYEALEGKLLEPTDEERAAFVESYRDAIADEIGESGRDVSEEEEEEEDGPCRGADAGCSCGAPGCVDYSVDRSLDNHADDCAECQDLPIDEAGDE